MSAFRKVWCHVPYFAGVVCRSSSVRGSHVAVSRPFRLSKFTHYRAPLLFSRSMANNDIPADALNALSECLKSIEEQTEPNQSIIRNSVTGILNPSDNKHCKKIQASTRFVSLIKQLKLAVVSNY